MPMTTFWRNATGDHSIGEADIGTMVDVCLALFTSNPTEAVSLASEITAAGRQLLSGKMSSFVNW
jgi:hypothetical protein